MDQNITCKLLLKNGYQTPNTPGRTMTTQKKKKKKIYSSNDPIRRENRPRNFFGKKSFFPVDLGQKKVKNITNYLLWALIYIFWMGYNNQNLFQNVTHKNPFKMDPNFTFQIFHQKCFYSHKTPPKAK